MVCQGNVKVKRADYTLDKLSEYNVNPQNTDTNGISYVVAGAEVADLSLYTTSIQLSFVSFSSSSVSYLPHLPLQSFHATKSPTLAIHLSSLPFFWLDNKTTDSQSCLNHSQA
jgi:hypothetical protein